MKTGRMRTGVTVTVLLLGALALLAAAPAAEAACAGWGWGTDFCWGYWYDGALVPSAGGGQCAGIHGLGHCTGVQT